jgi:antitoxin VapB
MAISIKNPDADRLARELARRQGRSITDVVIAALEAELAREKKRVRSPGTIDRILAIGRRYTALPDLDRRSDDEILGYDEEGIPR